MISKEIFTTNLINFITSLLDSKNILILVADINEHEVEEKLVKKLKRIGMIDTFFKKFNSFSSALHVLGSVLIVRVYAISNIAPHLVSLFPYNFRVDDYRVFLVDFKFSPIVERRVSIYAPQMRQLICNNQVSITSYNKKL